MPGDVPGKGDKALDRLLELNVFPVVLKVLLLMDVGFVEIVDVELTVDLGV